MNTILFWLSAYLICGMVVFVALALYSRKFQKGWAEVCGHGWRGAALGLLTVMVTWLPAALAGVVTAIVGQLKSQSERETIRAQAVRLCAAFEELERAMPEADRLLQEIVRLRAELDLPPAGEQAAGLRARMDDLERRHLSICSLAGKTMVLAMVGLCLDCQGPLREATPREGVGARCGACGAFFPYANVGSIVEELKRRGVPLWKGME